MPLRVGQKIRLEIQSLISDGRGLARHEGLAVFIAGTLPGQQVEATVTVVKARLTEARLDAILVNAPYVRPALCPHSDECGGCAWQDLPYPQQLAWKQRFVADALQRIGRVPEPPVLPILASPLEWHYRNKMEFAFVGQGEGLSLGLRRRASHDIVDVTGCLLQTDLTMQVVEIVRREARRSGLAAWSRKNGGWWRFLVIREPAAGGCLVELIAFPHPDTAKRGRAVAEAVFMDCPEVDAVVLSERAALADIANGEQTRLSLFNPNREQGAAELEEDLEGLRLKLGVGVFFQVNTAAAILLYNEVTRLAAMKTVRKLWDLYCGVGSIGLFLARNLAAGDSDGVPADPPLAVLGIEQSVQAVQMARLNAAMLLASSGVSSQISARYEQGDAGRLIGKLVAARCAVPDLAVVDPPRNGLAPEVTAALCRLRPERILYVSCNPATLARDAARLAPYSLKTARPVDLFPQTPHVECVALFEA